MKSILVPTDFSANALKALRFALQIAKESKAELTVMHQTSILELAPDSAFTGLYVPAPLDQVEYARKRLAAFVSLALRSFPNSNLRDRVKSEIVPGVGTVDIILETQKRVKADLIVMGTTGASGLKRLFIGSVAAHVIERAPVPVLVIPESYRLKPLKKLGFASDLAHVEQDLKKVLPLAEILGAEVEMFHVEPTFPTSEAFIKFRPDVELPALRKKFKFEGLNYHLVKTRYDNDFYTGVETYRRSRKPDVLAVITHKRSWWGKIVEPSKSKGLAYHTHIPVLTIK